MSDEIVLGTWGNVAQLIGIIHENKIRSIKILSTEKILRDRYGNLLFEREQNSFMKAELVSEKRDGKWIYYITTRKELEEIGMKLSKRKQFFEPSPEFLNFLRIFSTEKDIVSAINSIVPISH